MLVPDENEVGFGKGSVAGRTANGIVVDPLAFPFHHKGSVIDRVDGHDAIGGREIISC